MFSVVIPAHNAEPHLGHAIRSVRNQKLPAEQIVVVADACSDATANVAAELGCEVIETNLMHGGLARNVGVEAARERYTAFLDADDTWLPEHLKRVAGLFAQDPEQVGVLNAFQRYTAGQPIRNPKQMEAPFDEPRAGLSDEQYLCHHESCGYFPGMTAVTVRRDRFIQIGGFAAQMPRRHDMEMWLRLVRGCRWAWDPEPTTVYQVATPGSLSSNVAERELYALRAWTRQLGNWNSPQLVCEMRKAARRALAAAATDGRPTDLPDAIAEVWPHLGLRDRVFAAAARIAPTAFRGFNLARRRTLAAARNRFHPQLLAEDMPH